MSVLAFIIVTFKLSKITRQLFHKITQTFLLSCSSIISRTMLLIIFLKFKWICSIYLIKIFLMYIKTFHWPNYMHCMKSVRIRSCSGPHFPAVGLNTEKYSVSLRIQSECGEMQNSITPNTDIFYTVMLFDISFTLMLAASFLILLIMST